MRPRRCPQHGQPSRNTAPYGNWAWLCDPGLGRLDPVWETWITDSLAYPVWDYSACKRPVYLLREGQIHNPSVDTWMAEERELHLLARPAPRGGSPCQAAVVAGRNTWWGSDGRASRWQLPPLPRAMIVEGPGRKPENTVPDTSPLAPCPGVGLATLVRAGSPAPRSWLSKNRSEISQPFFP